MSLGRLRSGRLNPMLGFRSIPEFPRHLRWGGLGQRRDLRGDERPKWCVWTNVKNLYRSRQGRTPRNWKDDLTRRDVLPVSETQNKGLVQESRVLSQTVCHSWVYKQLTHLLHRNIFVVCLIDIKISEQIPRNKKLSF